MPPFPPLVEAFNYYFAINKEEVHGFPKSKSTYFLNPMLTEFVAGSLFNWIMTLGTKSVQSIEVVYDFREVVYLACLIILVSVELLFEIFVKWKKLNTEREESKPLLD